MTKDNRHGRKTYHMLQQEKWMVYAKRADFAKIGEQFGIDPVLARVIRNRDIVGEEQIRQFLYADLSDLYSPHLLKDLDLMVSILREKIAQKKKIHIIGDYDIDGVQATYIMYQGIKRVGGDVSFALPNRMKDGYGLNINLIEEALQEGVDTIVTCDNGIAAIEEIAFAKEHGMTVLVTDHHEVPYTEDEGQRKWKRSDADAIVNPKQPKCQYPFREICGAVVAWKVIIALYDAYDLPKEAALEFIENAAFATVGDVMELRDENRIIVKYGLEQMRKTENYGLRALIHQNGICMEELSTYHLGFVLGPCINASGRLDTAVRSMRLMLSENEAKAACLAAELVHLNEERKAMTQKGIEWAEEYIQKNDLKENKVLVIYLPKLHESLAGIVAGRIKERYNRPVFVLTDAMDGVKGSGRSIEAFSMYEEMCKCQELFSKFGGHPMAAGLSLDKHNIEEFAKRMNENTSLTKEDLIPKIQIDVAMPMGYVTYPLIKSMELLEPFGTGNRRPLFAQKDVVVKRSNIVGKNQNTLKLVLKDEEQREYHAVYFGDAARMQEYIMSKERISIVYYPKINQYMGNKEIQFIIQNIK